MITIIKCLMVLLMVAGSGGDCPNVKTSLGSIRKRRHLTFPDGTNFAEWIFWGDVSFNFKFSSKLNETGLLEDREPGEVLLERSKWCFVAYLPQREKGMTISLVKAFMTHAPSGWNSVIEIDVTFPMPNSNFTNAYFRRKQHHREKRQIWQRLQSALDLHNLNGEACIIRSICEARTHLAPPGESLVHDLLRVVFTASAGEIEGGYEALLDPAVCDKANDCPISLLHFVLALNRQKY